MIELTRLNGSPLLLNSDLIKSAESAPDTMITLLNGEKLIVRESCSQLVDKIIAFRAQLLAEVAKLLPPNADSLRLLAAAALSGALTNEAALNNQPLTETVRSYTARNRRRRDTDDEEWE